MKGRIGDGGCTRACESYTLQIGHHWKMAYDLTSCMIITTCLQMFELGVKTFILEIFIV